MAKDVAKDTLQTREIVVRVVAPSHLSGRRVAGLVRQCIEVGLCDAADTVDNPEINNPDALAASLLELDRVDFKPQRKKKS